ncbi:MAG: glycoside hydrolase family 13 protein, partial [Candidatus Cloacimonetes bacterium]|nr:glycoside hydrolase family 13 protein [Candidatus Cloacimonadota bacterium]
PRLGKTEDFQKFVKELHKRGMKIIIDTAFNHTGDTFFAFRDAVNKGHESPYYNWYEWKKWPIPDPLPHGETLADYYNCWWGFGEMPDLNYDLSRDTPHENSVRNISEATPNQPLIDYVLGVADYWIGEMDVDGFRLDVPNEVPFWFWELFRKRVKTLKSDAYLVGEIWSNASEWINEKYFDAVMNYAYFKDPVIRFFALRKCNAQTFDHDLKPALSAYPTQAQKALMNILDSYDTMRFLQIAGEDVKRLRLALLFQMTYIGVPHIWYGDEIGMTGGKDPDNRRPFNWNYEQETWRVELRDYYRILIQLRKTHAVFVDGTFHVITVAGMAYAFLRSNDSETIVVLINNSDSKHTFVLDNLASSYTDLLNSRQLIAPEIQIAPMSGLILLANKEEKL